MPEAGIPFLEYGNSRNPTVVIVGDGRSRVRKVVRTTTRHVTVVSYSTRHKESRTHTSHHVTTVSFPQKPADRGSPAYAIQGSNSSGGYVYMQQQQHYMPPPPQQQQQQQLSYQHQLCHQVHPGHQSAVQTLHKKGSIRNGSDVLKRSRTQNAYELSQDLLDKQIELLERKYGGVRARNAAITIQRAFRHYTMVKKFASITAMAKAEKRLSRRLPMQQQQQLQEVQYIDDKQSSTSAYGSGDPELSGSINSSNSIVTTSGGNGIQRVCATITATPAGARMTPIRSMSLRERRSLDVSPNQRSGNSSPMPNSCWQQQQQQGICGAGQSPNPLTQHSHPHVNVLHTEQHYYSTPTPQPYHQQQYQPPQTHQIQQYCLQDISMNASSQMDASMNSSWNSLQNSPSSTIVQPYYSAAQIYMRPRTNSTQMITSGATNSSTASSVTCSSTSSINSIASSKRVPPEVPKRTSSITSQQRGERSHHHHHHHHHHDRSHHSGGEHTPTNRSMHRTTNGLSKTAENGSLSSVQSSGSDSSAERIHCGDIGSDRSTSPQWKRKTGILIAQSPDHHLHLMQQQQQQQQLLQQQHPHPQQPHPQQHHHNNNLQQQQQQLHSGVTSGLNHSMNIGGSLTDNECMNSHTSAAQYSVEHHEQLNNVPVNYKISETVRKRQYRVGLNLFNKKSEKGIAYLIRRGFLENTPQGVARFLISRKGLSRQMIGEYLGNLQNQFNMAVLECFASELDLSGMQVDVALRKFQAYFRMPGEAQKIERLMEIFSQRYCHCNADIVARLRSSDTVFVMAFAIIMLNTDLHTPNLKPERRMRVEDFVKNLRGIDDCHDIDRDMLAGIYERIKVNEFKPGSDHVTQVMKVQATIVGKKPNLALPHRRLVCYCRLYEIPDINKKERPGVHQREVFLFNDLLVITKIFSKKKSSVTYTFRNSFPLCGMVVTLLDVPNYPYCIRLSQKVDGKALVTFNARNEHDRCKFAEDLRESISEMDEMEALRIEAELDKQKSTRGGNRSGNSENRDSGVADVEVCPCPYQSPQNEVQHEAAQLKRSALSNSLLDMHEQFGATEKSQRRGSVGSLDSGMSISFQSTSASTGSRSDTKARLIQHGAVIGQHPGFLGGIFHKRERKLSKSDEGGSGMMGAAAAAVAALPIGGNLGQLPIAGIPVATAVANGGGGGGGGSGPFGRSTEV